MNRKTLAIIFGLILVIVLVSGSFVSVKASSLNEKPTHETTPGAKATQKAEQHATEGIGKGKNKSNYKGVISTVSETSLSLTLEDNSTVDFLITSDTQIHIPGLGKEAAPINLAEGMTVHVRAQKEGDVYTAIAINVIPGKPSKIHAVGEVTDYQEGTAITIKAVDGNEYTFIITGETKILPGNRAGELKVGSRVTVISPRDPATGQQAATGIVVHPEGSGSGTPEPVEAPEIEPTK